jgi:glycosyltransferase involved in cell wall biosynthesis
VPEAYFRRREQEWALADRVVVNSEFSRQALIQQGVPESKLSVIPLCYEAPVSLVSQEHRWLGDGPGPALRVLWLGLVVLRKGIQYLLQAARMLADERIQFDVVGPIGISDEAMKSAPSNVTFHGRASRDQASLWYQRADVFVLPTLSDGFALTQLEAMAHGLPVIATPNCGEVVTHGVDGLIVPPRDAESLARAIHRYLAEPDLLRQNRAAALQKVGQFSFSHLADHLGNLEMKITGSSCRASR